jgi:nucleoside-diphosphate-sugar epimerase
MVGVDSFPSAPYPAAYAYALFNELKAKLRGRPTSMNREVVKTFRSHNSFSNAKARGLLGWEPAVGFEQGMRETEEWLKAEGWLG